MPMGMKVSQRAYPQSCALRMTAPAAEVGFRACGHDQRTEPVWRLCDRPLETSAPCGDNSWMGRGGSVSRRDHNHPAGNRTPLTGGTN